MEVKSNSVRGRSRFLGGMWRGVTFGGRITSERYKKAIEDQGKNKKAKNRRTEQKEREKYLGKATGKEMA